MISYKPLLKLLIDRGIQKQELLESAKISWATMSKLNTNNYVSLEVIDKICGALDCNIEQVIEYVPDQKEND